MLSLETVTPELLALTKKLMREQKLQDFRLVGGTALALQLGHRKSVDIDLFCNKEFDALSVEEHLKINFDPTESQHTTNSVMCKIEGIKVDIIAHRHPWIENSIKEDGIRMASIRDIAGMKIHAINQAGTRQKDFVDLYFLLEKLPLNEIITAYGQKYPDSIPNIAKESIRTFDRMDPEPKIKLLGKSIPWTKVKTRLQEAVLQPNKVFKENNIANLLPKKRTNSNSHRRKPGL